MTTFYIVRHGKTLFNQKRLVQGWCDSPLIEEGITQAKQLHEGLEYIPFTLGVSSTSERAMDTLDYIVQNKFPTKAYKGLKEINFGQIEGSKIVDSLPNGIQESYEDIGGENIYKAVDRAKNVLKEISENHQDENILVVTHGGIIYYFLEELNKSFVEGKGLPAQVIPNCSVMILEYKDGIFTVKSLPSTQYLKEIKR